MAGRQRALAGYLFHGDGGLTTRTVHGPLAGKVPAGRVNNEIVHIVDLYTTLARIGETQVPKDRPIDGVDQLDFFLGKQESSNCDDFPPTWPTGCRLLNGGIGKHI